MRITQEIQLADYKIVDMHLHLPVAADDWLAPWRERYIRENGEARFAQLQSRTDQKSWLPEFCFPSPEPAMEKAVEAADRWAQEVDNCGLEKVIFASGGDNETLAKVVARHPDKFAGLAHHYIGAQDAAHTLEKAVRDLGLKGYKILAPLVEKPLSDRCYDDIFEVCHAYKLPVLVHCGILGGGSFGIVSGPNLSPLCLAETAQRFPNANFIVPHFGCGFTNDLLQLCWASPNVYVDTSGNNLWTKWTMENYTLEQLFQRFYACVGPERILFGSDSEWFPRGFALRYLMDQLRAVRGLNIPEEDIRRIFRENALELFRLEGGMGNCHENYSTVCF